MPRKVIVHPAGIEPTLLVPETNVLSVELRMPKPASNLYLCRDNQNLQDKESSNFSAIPNTLFSLP